MASKSDAINLYEVKTRFPSCEGLRGWWAQFSPDAIMVAKLIFSRGRHIICQMDGCHNGGHVFIKSLKIVLKTILAPLRRNDCFYGVCRLFIAWLIILWRLGTISPTSPWAPLRITDQKINSNDWDVISLVIGCRKPSGHQDAIIAEIGKCMGFTIVGINII